MIEVPGRHNYLFQFLKVPLIGRKEAMLLFAVPLIFVVPPIPLILLLFAIGFLSEDGLTSIIPLLAIFIASYLGFINYTKVPESDYAVYLEWYKSAKDLPFFEFLTLYSREPVYYIALYLIANAPFSSEGMFVFISTFISYALLAYSLLSMCEFLDLSLWTRVSLLVVVLMFPPLFSLSAHLMRQFLAASIVMMFYSEKVVKGRNRWFLLFFATMIHSSAILFFLLSQIGKIRKLSFSISMVLSVLVVLTFIMITRALFPLVSDLPVLGLVAARILEVGINLKSNISANLMIFVALMTTISLANIHESWNQNIAIKNMIRHGRIDSTVLFVAMLVVAANFINGMSEISLRYYFYLYFFMALTIPIFFSYYRRSRVFLYLFAVLTPSLFYVNIAVGQWKYAPIYQLLLFPSWNLTR